MARTSHSGYSEQSKASKHRLEDAEALDAAKRWRGAMYMSGYAVECLLKAKLMQVFGCVNLEALEEELQRRGLLDTDSTVFTHRLEQRLNLTGGIDRMRANPTAWRQFALVNHWIPAWRYTSNMSNAEDCQAFLDAARAVMHWVEHNV